MLPLQLVKLAGLTLLTCEVLARIGSPLTALTGCRRRGPGKAALDLLVGASVTGIAFLGLALASLAFPATVLGGIALLLAASLCHHPRRPAVLAALLALRRAPAPAFGVLVAAGIPIVGNLLPLDANFDACLYHYGASWHFLMAHRVLITDVPTAFHIPLPVEMTFWIPFLLHDDRLAKWLVAAAFGAGLTVAAAGTRGSGGAAAVLGPILAVSASHAIFGVAVCKNDMAAVGLFLAGASLVRARAWATGFVVFGLCAASKLVYAPLIAAWCLGAGMPGAALLQAAGCLVLPYLLWALKSWLATGNPLFPFAAGLLPGFGLDARNVAVFGQVLGAEAIPGADRLANLPQAFARTFLTEHPGLCLALPAAFVFGRRRKDVLLLLAGAVAILGLGHIARYLLPALCLLSLLAADGVGRIPGRAGRGLAAALILHGVVRIWLHPGFDLPRWRDGALGPRAAAAKALTTFDEAVTWLADRSPHRTLAIGEYYSYRVPGRILYNGTRGETPIVWRIVHDAATERDVATGFRQLGADYLLLNYVTTPRIATMYGSFPWDDRMGRLYAAFYRSHLVTERQFATCDQANGGYIVYRFTRTPLDPRPATLYFLPGAESLLGTAYADRKAGALREAIAATQAVIRAYPGIWSFRAELGFQYAQAKDWPRAYAELKPVVARGVPDATSLQAFGTAATNLGRLDEASAALTQALATHPGNTHSILLGLGTVCYARAYQAAVQNRGAAAAAAAAEGIRFLSYTPESGDGELVGLRAAKLASCLGLLADVDRARGDLTGAKRHYLEAWQLTPDAPGADAWKRAADQLP